MNLSGAFAKGEKSQHAIGKRKEIGGFIEQKSEMYLAVCELAFQCLYLDLAKTAVDELRVFETAPSKDVSLTVAQSARLRFYDALITAARPEGSEDVRKLASAQFCSAVEFCIPFVKRDPENLGMLLLDFLQVERQFLETPDKARCLTSAYSVLHHVLRPFVDKILSGDDVESITREDKIILRFYVDCQAKFALMLQSKQAHSQAYEVFEDACKVQERLVDAQRETDSSFDGDTRTLEVLREGQSVSFGIMRGLMEIDINKNLYGNAD